MKSQKLKSIIKETFQKYLSEKDDKCGCGCDGDCHDKAPLLKENLGGTLLISEGLYNHIDEKKPLYENLYRAGSTKYFELWKEARALYKQGLLEVNEIDKEILLETDLGEWGMFEGKLVPLDFPIEEAIQGHDDMDLVRNAISNMAVDSSMANPKDIYYDSNYRPYLELLVRVREDWGPDSDLFTELIEAFWNEGNIDLRTIKEILYKYDVLDEYEWLFGLNEEKKKKDPPLNKPQRDSSGGKAYKVYVRDPKTKNIKTVRFGSGGLKAKINNPKARKAFAKRHKCSQAKDKTKASYWSCRLPRFSKLLGLKSTYTGYW